MEYEKIVEKKQKLLRQAFERFLQRPVEEEYLDFCRQAAFWLEDYALFMALKDRHGGLAWTEWPSDIARRDTDALDRQRRELSSNIEFYRFSQYLFFSQWRQLRQRANTQGIRVIGDLPIFVAHDSADVWASPRLFDLDAAERPKTRAGVPPDYFSETGQLWGNPHYNWRQHGKQNFSWWISRVEWLLQSVDALRIDHFRGFEAFWEIPAQAKTAVHGRWVKGPGKKFFNALWRHLGPAPIIAEDLGVITPEVVQLRESFFFHDDYAV